MKEEFLENDVDADFPWNMGVIEATCHVAKLTSSKINIFLTNGVKLEGVIVIYDDNAVMIKQGDRVATIPFCNIGSATLDNFSTLISQF